MLWLFFILPMMAQDPALLETSVHKGIECTSCHTGEVPEGAAMPAPVCSTCHPEIHARYETSIHGKLQTRGISSAASCSSCHGSHAILPMGNPTSPIYKKNVAATCGQCHSGIASQFEQSIHGTALAGGNFDAPTCTDCHGEHSILPHLEKLSRVYPTNIAKTTCPQCHANERLAAKYNLPRGKVESFKDTYHGLAGTIGDTQVAHCASCHGVHNILPSSNAQSTIHPDHLADTCGQCHPNAGENFIKGTVHGPEPGHIAERIGSSILWFYIILTVVVVGGYFLHNLLDYLKKVRAIYRHRLTEPSYPRMSRNERIQHALLFSTFFTLVITGFALKFGWTIPFAGDRVNSLLRSSLHRASGAIMIVLLGYHLFYIAFTARGRQIFRDMMPRWKDGVQIIQYILYLVGRRKEKPLFGRFSYWEKMEYWSVLWGCFIMGLTGALLWAENLSLQYMPKWGLDIVTLVHYLEAILATLAILIGHLYFVILNPSVAPMSFVWISGRIPHEQAMEEHPAAYGEDQEKTKP